MTTIAAEIQDCDLVASGTSGARVSAGPGLALLEGGQLLLGREAQHKARLQPRRVYDRFWHQLGTGALPRPFPATWRAADLAHAHLVHLWALVEETEPASQAVIAVPACFGMDQLGLLLGIARSASIPVAGFVDSAVAAVTTGDWGGRVLYLDVLLHQCLITEIEGEQMAQRRRAVRIEAAGMNRLMDLWVKYVARMFVHQTRFDPLHRAGDEQWLYERLPAWLSAAATAERVVASSETQGGERSIELSSDALAEAVSDPFESIVASCRALAAEGEPPTLVVSPRTARLADLSSRLANRLQIDLAVAGENATLEGTLSHLDTIASGTAEVRLVTALPRRRGPLGDERPNQEPVASSSVDVTVPLPTHLLYSGVAYAITEQPLRLGAAVEPGPRGIRLTEGTEGISRRHCQIFATREGVVVEDTSRYGTFVNEQRIAGRQQLRAGDRLRLGSPGIEIELIRVARTDGET